MTPQRTHPTIGACGIDCGLCPRYRTHGPSRCPGCCGPGFEAVHPSCVVVTCCVIKRGLPVCAECAEYPCAIFERPATTRDSFVTHRRMAPNQEAIRDGGLDAFVAAQAERLALLDAMLDGYNAGRSTSFYCLAAALLSIDGLCAAIGAVPRDGDARTRARRLGAELDVQAALEQVDLALQPGTAPA